MVDNIAKQSSRLTVVKDFLSKINRPRSLYAYLAVIFIVFSFMYGPMMMADYARKQYDDQLVESVQNIRQIPNTPYISPPSETGQFSLHQAIRENKFRRFLNILKSSVDVDMQETFNVNEEITVDNASSTALIIAANHMFEHAKPNQEYIIRLIRAGAEVNVIDKMGRSPLLGACLSGLGYRQLIDAGANPLMKLPDGNTIFSSCIAQKGIRAQTIMEDTQYAPEDLNQALLALVGSCKGFPANETGKELYRMLLRKGADPNVQNIKGDSVLVSASRKCPTEIVKLILKTDGFIDLPNSKTGETAITVSMFSGYKYSTDTLAQAGANVNVTDTNGMPPLTKMLTMNALKPGNILYLKTDTAKVKSKLLQDNIEAISKEDNYVIERIKYSRLKSMLSYGADPNIESHDGTTPLIASIESNCSRCVSKLLDSGANPIAKNSEGKTALDFAQKLPFESVIYRSVTASAKKLEYLDYRQMNAYIYSLLEKKYPIPSFAKFTDINKLEVAIEAGINVNVSDVLGRSPLSMACVDNRADIFKLLVQQGADPNLVNTYGITPLMFCASKQGKLLSDLLNAGSQVNAVDVLGETALLLAVNNCKNSADSNNNVRSLLEGGANVKFDDLKIGLLSVVIQRSCSAGIFKLLKDAGADPGETNEQGKSLLQLSIDNGNDEITDLLIEGEAKDSGIFTDNIAIHELFDRGEYQIVQSLLQSGSDPNLLDANENSLLLKSAQLNQDDLVSLLINLNADVNLKNYNGATALIYAVKNGKLDSVKLLLDKHAEININDSLGNTPISSAVESGRLDILKLLVDGNDDLDALYNNKSTYLIDAIKSQSYEMIKFFLDKNVDINLPDKQGVTPLLHAINNGLYNIVRIIVEAGANLSDSGSGVFLPLQLAVNNKEFGISRLLIEHGAFLEASDIDGKLPLMLAINNADIKLVRLLVESGANVNAKDRMNNSVLSLAIDQDNLQIVEYLLKQGADVNAVNSSGQTPILKAANLSKNDIVMLLIKYGASVN